MVEVEIWSKCHTNLTDTENWKHLLASSGCILRTASLGGGKYKFHNEKLINERIARWENGNRGPMWNEAILSKAAKKARETSTQKEKNVGKSEDTMSSRLLHQ